MRNYAWLCLAPRRALAAFGALVLASCAATAPPSAPESPPPSVIAPPAVESEPDPPRPAPRPPASSPSRADVVVVVDTTTGSYTSVAAAIADELPPRRYRVTEIASSATDELAALRDRPVTLIAVGANAVTAARTQLPDKPLVFCQVVAPEMLVGDAKRVWGVRALPPLSLQLRSWRAVDPTLRTVALIVSEAQAALAAEAEQAARDNATDLVVETSASDRETLYLFRRIAAEVDGLWLLPDNQALSPTALRELLSYATARGIGVLTFNDALLRRGALLSAMSLPEDVAATVHAVVERVVAGKTSGLAAVTPLSAATVEVNAAVAGELGLERPQVTRWVTREAD
jgi:ABC-type uncharacterized transport system substrate-binding protein